MSHQPCLRITIRHITTATGRPSTVLWASMGQASRCLDFAVVPVLSVGYTLHHVLANEALPDRNTLFAKNRFVDCFATDIAPDNKFAGAPRSLCRTQQVAGRSGDHQRSESLPRLPFQPWCCDPARAGTYASFSSDTFDVGQITYTSSETPEQLDRGPRRQHGIGPSEPTAPTTARLWWKLRWHGDGEDAGRGGSAWEGEFRRTIGAAVLRGRIRSLISNSKGCRRWSTLHDGEHVSLSSPPSSLPLPFSILLPIPSPHSFCPRSLDTASPCAPARLGQIALDPFGHRLCVAIGVLLSQIGLPAVCACDAALPHGTKKLAIFPSGVQSCHFIPPLHALPNRLPSSKATGNKVSCG